MMYPILEKKEKVRNWIKEIKKKNNNKIIRLGWNKTSNNQNVYYHIRVEEGKLSNF